VSDASAEKRANRAILNCYTSIEANLY